MLLSGCAGSGGGWDLVSLAGGTPTPAPPKPDGTTAHPYPAEPSSDPWDDYNANWITLPDGRSVLCVHVMAPGSTGSSSISCDFEHVREPGAK